MKRVLFLCLIAIPALGNPISAGVKAGVPLDRTGQSDANTKVDKPRWIIGPTIEVALPGGFAMGVDALYRQLGYVTSRNAGPATFFEKSSTSHWEVPLYLKYRLRERAIRPFFLAGGAFEHASISGRAGCTGDAMLCGSALGTWQLESNSWGGGYLFGGGVEFSVGAVKVAPEFRYTRWFRGYFAGAGSDQPALLLGFRF